MLRWAILHLPITTGIAATGAAMVSLVEHATEIQAPTATSWLFAGSVALMLTAIIPTTRTLSAHHRETHLYRPLSVALAIAAAAALLTGWARPAPLALVTAMALILGSIWTVGLYQWLTHLSTDQTEPA